jgi:hypothetical protein
VVHKNGRGVCTPLSTFEVKNAEKPLTPNYKGETPRSKHHNGGGGRFCLHNFDFERSVFVSRRIDEEEDEDLANQQQNTTVRRVNTTVTLVLDVTVVL